MTKVYKPVDKYRNQETIKFSDGKRLVVEVEIRGRNITMRNSKGWAIATMLRPDHALCALVEDDAGGVPEDVREAIMVMVAMAEGQGHRLTVQKVRDWLSSPTQKGGGDELER